MLKRILKITICDTSSRLQAHPTSTLPLPKKKGKKRKEKHQVFLFSTAFNAAVVADPLIIGILLSISVMLSL